MFVVATLRNVKQIYMTKYNILGVLRSVQFSSVAQSWLAVCNPIDCRTPTSLSINNFQSLLKLLPIQSVVIYNHLILCCLLLLLHCFPASRSFPMSQVFTSAGQSVGASASALVLPMNIQDWFPLLWIGWISLKFKGLSRVFSNTTVQKHWFFSAQLSL